MTWLARNAAQIEAVAATITAATAILAVVAVSWQLKAAEDLARAQTARDAYANHLVLAANTPDFAAPNNACSLLASPKAVSYTAFVDHLLYAAEQMLATEDGWDDTFVAALEPHKAYICSTDGLMGTTPQMDFLLAQFRATECKMTADNGNSCATTGPVSEPKGKS